MAGPNRIRISASAIGDHAMTARTSARSLDAGAPRVVTSAAPAVRSVNPLRVASAPTSATQATTADDQMIMYAASAHCARGVWSLVRLLELDDVRNAMASSDFLI